MTNKHGAKFEDLDQPGFAFASGIALSAMYNSR